MNEVSGIKTYLSARQSLIIYGGNRYGMIRFVNGRYVTDDPGIQSIIENSRWFKNKEIIVEGHGFLDGKQAQNERRERSDEVESLKKEIAELKAILAKKQENPDEDIYHDSTSYEEPQEKKFICDVCGKEFENQNQLNGHRTVHIRMGEIPKKGAEE